MFLHLVMISSVFGALAEVQNQPGSIQTQLTCLVAHDSVILQKSKNSNHEVVLDIFSTESLFDVETSPLGAAVEFESLLQQLYNIYKCLKSKAGCGAIFGQIEWLINAEFTYASSPVGQSEGEMLKPGWRETLGQAGENITDIYLKSVFTEEGVKILKKQGPKTATLKVKGETASFPGKTLRFYLFNNDNQTFRMCELMFMKTAKFPPKGIQIFRLPTGEEFKIQLGTTEEGFQIPVLVSTLKLTDSMPVQISFDEASKVGFATIDSDDFIQASEREEDEAVKPKGLVATELHQPDEEGDDDVETSEEEKGREGTIPRKHPIPSIEEEEEEIGKESDEFYTEPEVKSLESFVEMKEKEHKQIEKKRLESLKEKYLKETLVEEEEPVVIEQLPFKFDDPSADAKPLVLESPQEAHKKFMNRKEKAFAVHERRLIRKKKEAEFIAPPSLTKFLRAKEIQFQAIEKAKRKAVQKDKTVTEKTAVSQTTVVPEKTFFQRYSTILIAVIVLLVGTVIAIAAYHYMKRQKSKSIRI